MKLERRYAQIELRAEGEDSAEIRGYAAVFNQLSQDLGGFRERIAPGAFTDSLDGDVRALWNHNTDFPIGRTKNETLSLREDDHGLAIVITPPNSTYGRDFVEAIRRGDVDQMSFAFSVEDEDQEWRDEPGTGVVRTVKRVKLYEVSPVTFPAYLGTEVSARELPEEFRQASNSADSEKDAQTQARRARRQRRIEILTRM